MSAMARLTRRFIPPEKLSTLSRARSSSPTRSRFSLAATFASLPDSPAILPKKTRLSVAESSGYSASSCGQTPMILRTWSLSPVTELAPMVISPSSGRSTVESILMVVVFPAPLGPSSPKISCRRMEKETSSTAVMPSKCLRRCWAVRKSSAPFMATG